MVSMSNAPECEQPVRVNVSTRRLSIGWFIAAASVLGACVWAGPAFAGQGTAPASIIGRVTDESGAVLPGVTVTVTGPSLQVPQMAGRGEYRLPPRPIGTDKTTYDR